MQWSHAVMTYVDTVTPLHTLTWTVRTHSGFLCPPVPQRANYIHWIEDLLAGNTETTIKLPLAVGIPALATGLDIGVVILFCTGT